jgi:hypothetical protein
MHFHLPKPLHGWREFTGEVGIIVIGVLIALSAEQVVQNWHWDNEVAVVRDSIVGELANDRARWQRDLWASHCAVADIDRLDRWASEGAKPPTPPTGSLQSENLLSMHSANWKLATGSQTLAHFPMREQLAFAALYDGLGNRELDIARASDEMDRVHTLIPLAGDAQKRQDLRETLGDLRNTLGDLFSNVGYMKRHFDAVGVMPDRSDIAGDPPVSGCGSGGVKAG